jgi:hypothetical protein
MGLLCNLKQSTMFAEKHCAGEVQMKHGNCPELYSCPKVRMTPMIRMLLRCTAAEAMESICATCERNHSEGEQNHNYVASSGRTVKLFIEDGNIEVKETLADSKGRR